MVVMDNSVKGKVSEWLHTVEAACKALEYNKHCLLGGVAVEDVAVDMDLRPLSEQELKVPCGKEHKDPTHVKKHKFVKEFVNF